VVLDLPKQSLHKTKVLQVICVLQMYILFPSLAQISKVFLFLVDVSKYEL
jgi:hypothetical protein